MREFTEGGAIRKVLIQLNKHYEDERGYLSEIWRCDGSLMVAPSMAYISLTNPGVVRGPHEHKAQTDIFVFGLRGRFRLFLWDNRETSETYNVRQCMTFNAGDGLTTVVIPPGVVHAYKNFATCPGLVLNMPDQLFRGTNKDWPVDEIRHEDQEDTPFVLW